MPDRLSSNRGNGHNGHGYPPLPVDAAFSVDYVQRLRFTRDVLSPANPVLGEVLA